jgi:hypothetical protein
MSLEGYALLRGACHFACRRVLPEWSGEVLGKARRDEYSRGAKATSRCNMGASSCVDFHSDLRRGAIRLFSKDLLGW